MSPRAVSVVMPTFDRARVLERTLEGFTRLDLSGLEVEFVIVDNNSTDETARVLEASGSRLPLRPLFESEPGKNRALNRALEAGDLRELVVFTDDDVDADPLWLQKIIEVSDRHPDHSVFGGRIEVVWPTEDRPAWTEDRYIRTLGFTEHRYAETEVEYEVPHYPFGPNFWVRRPVLEGRRFDVQIGPHPTNRILGDETLFLQKIVADGHPALYSPEPWVGHRVEAKMLTVPGIYQRAYQLGRGIPHLRGLPQRETLASSPVSWRMRRRVALAYHRLGALFGRLILDPDERVRFGVRRRRDIGYNVEALYLARSGEEGA